MAHDCQALRQAKYWAYVENPNEVTKLSQNTCIILFIEGGSTIPSLHLSLGAHLFTHDESSEFQVNCAESAIQS